MLRPSLTDSLASLHHHVQHADRRFTDRAIELTPHSDAVRLPALELERPGRALLRVLDFLTEGVLLVDDAGSMFYRNPSLERTLLEDDDRGALLREMRYFALSLPRHAPAGTRDHGNGAHGSDSHRDGAHDDGGGTGGAATGCGPATRETRTATARYRMHATPLGDALPGAEHAVIVTLERLTLSLPSPLALANRFNLTACEAGVALLLAQGHSNGEIAKTLEISPHTARHHTESVLLKLNVHSRAEVGGKVLGTRRPSGPMRTV
ncbi:MAG TPA: helix-turn-helix transcriptional regulator [Gemmatimonadaceae bacterium]|nr:helix-turn-helix transcriptional regulator [Gemmatimonadaceae bacterium]